MATVPVTVRYPFVSVVQSRSQRKECTFPRKVDCSISKFPLNVDLSGISLCPGSASSKGLIVRRCAQRDINDFDREKGPTPVLDRIKSPLSLKKLTLEELKQLAVEIRMDLADIMSDAQISWKASMAVVELTVAIHRVFNAPEDKILWDVEDQTYVHKILTGRRSLMKTTRQKNGLSGFTYSRFDSGYDAFGAGHGCNSISAALGMGVARDIKGTRERIIAVISNLATASGQVHEAMTNAKFLGSNIVVIFNDSRHSLLPKVEEGPKTPINAQPSILSRLQSGEFFPRFGEAAKDAKKQIGGDMHELAAKVDEYADGIMAPLGSSFFKNLGFDYIGPVDGHNIENLICVLQEVAFLDSIGPVLVHVVTNENKGEENNEKDDIANGQQDGSINSGSLDYSEQPETYSNCFAETLVMEAEKDKDIVVVQAGISVQPSLEPFRGKFPSRFFDMGMAVQHAVTFASGLACGGLKPFCIIPSCFLQGAFDQVVRDVDRQRIPVRFVITSAGLVGSDGAVQSGAFDITFMSCLPNMIVMAPSDEIELMRMVATATLINDQPVCFRCPRDTVIRGEQAACDAVPIKIGQGRILVEGRDVALVGYGTMVQSCFKAHKLLISRGLTVTVVDARFCKPLDVKLLRELCDLHSFLITVEEGPTGGFGSRVAQFLAIDGLLDEEQFDGGFKWRPIVLPDRYMEGASPNQQLDQAGLSGHHIAATVMILLGRPQDALYFSYISES